MKDRYLVVIIALKRYIVSLEKLIIRTNPIYARALKMRRTSLETATKALHYYENLFIHGHIKHGKTAQEIEGSCEGCMHIACERDERPCSDCCRLDRVDRYEKEDPTLADVFPELHGGKDADHET